MWKWIGGGVALVVVLVAGLGAYLSDKIYLRFPHAAVASADFDKTYSPAQLRSDYRYLTAMVEHIHPDISAVIDPARYAAVKARTLAALDHPLTRLEFFRVIAPAVGRSYADGHTEILPPAEEWEAYQVKGGAAPPFTIRIDGPRIDIERSLGDPTIAPGSEIVSLNGVSAADLRAWLVDTQSMETEAGREAYGERRFAVLAWSLGLRAPYLIVTRAPGARAVSTDRSAGIPARDWKRRFALSADQPMRLSIDNGIAHLVVRDFDEPWNPYQAQLRSAFQEIQARHVRAVILDLRQNPGGDTRESDALQAYLSDEVLPATRSVAVKSTPEVKAIYRTLLPPGFRWIPLNQAIPMLAGIQNAPDNGVYVFHPDGAKPRERWFKEGAAFKGDLYILIGPATYSTAVIAAAPYKYWKRATLIGEETGEPLTFFGDNYAFDLPNTKLQMHVSHKRFVLFGSEGPRIGLEPDIATRPGQDAYHVALAQIARRKGGDPRP